MALSLSVSQRNINSFTFNVTGITASNYNLFYKVTPSDTGWVTKYTNTSGASKSFTVANLDEDSTYSCQIYIHDNSSGTNIYSPIVTQKTNKRPTGEITDRTSKTLTVKVTADTLIKAVSYTLDNGTTWYNLDVNPNSTTYTYTLGSLVPNKYYKVKTKIKHKNSDADSNTLQVSTSTYAIPNINVAPEDDFANVYWNSNYKVTTLEYKLNTYESFLTATSNAYNGNFNITNGGYDGSKLLPNKNYKLYMRFYYTRNVTANGESGTIVKENVTYTDLISDYSFNTYSYPYVDKISTSNLKIGNSQTLTIYNPFNRQITIFMKKDSTSGTQLYSNTTSGTSITFTPNATTLYNSIPNKNNDGTNNGTAVYYCVYSNQIVKTVSGKYYIDNTNGALNPTFTTSNWNYTVTPINLATSGRQAKVIVKNRSTITVNLSTAATGKYNATITSYRAEWGTLFKERNSTGNFASMSNGTSNEIKVIAEDSRGYKTITTRSNLEVVNYNDINLNTIETQREDGIGTDVKLEFYGRYYTGNFGTGSGATSGTTTTNTIQSIKYYTSTSNNFTGRPAYTISLSDVTINTSTGSFSLENYPIHYNGSSGGFDIGTKYYIKLEVQDELDTFSFYTTVTNGIIARDVYFDGTNYHEGINGLASPDYAQYIHGDIFAENLVCKQITTTGTNLNDYKTQGFYNFTSAYTPTNAPSGSSGILQVIKVEGAQNTRQIWYRWGTQNASDHIIYTRTYFSSAWSDWHKIMTSQDKEIITCGLSANFSYSGNTETLIPINKLISSCGLGYITLDTTNNKIKISQYAEFKYILVSFYAELYSSSPISGNGYVRLRIFKNNSAVSYGFALDGIASYRPNLVKPNFLIPVSPNDDITFKLYSNNANYSTIMESNNVHFTVEAVY